MVHNVIVLTVGLAGSSAVTGLVARAGYWTGDSTFKKHDYDTYENYDLIQLNRALMKLVGSDKDAVDKVDQALADQIADRADAIDPQPYRAFITKCDQHRPWIWKDPRLLHTIKAWDRWIDPSTTSFLLATRDPWQAWISTTLRRQVRSYGYTRRLFENFRAYCRDFLGSRGLPSLEVCFDRLMQHPQPTIASINAFLGTRLTVDDLVAVSSKTLYRRQYGLKDLGRAALIYAKNYNEAHRLDANA